MSEQLVPFEAIDRLLLVPHVEDRGDWLGADCWGIVELWYAHVLGIALDDRAAHPAGHGGLQAGFDAAEHWRPLDAPQDHCLVIMSAGAFAAGHVGVCFAGSVLHSDSRHGCAYQRLDDRAIRTRVTAYLKHMSL